MKRSGIWAAAFAVGLFATTALAAMPDSTKQSVLQPVVEVAESTGTSGTISATGAVRQSVAALNTADPATGASVAVAYGVQLKQSGPFDFLFSIPASLVCLIGGLLALWFLQLRRQSEAT